LPRVRRFGQAASPAPRSSQAAVSRQLTPRLMHRAQGRALANHAPACLSTGVRHFALDLGLETLYQLSVMVVSARWGDGGLNGGGEYGGITLGISIGLPTAGSTQRTLLHWTRPSEVI